MKHFKEFYIDLKENIEESPDILYDENNEPYYIDLREDSLEERKIYIRVNSKGQKIKKIKCGQGKVAKNIGGRIVCVVPTGSEKLTKKLAIKRSVRTKKAKGGGYKKRTNFRRQKALKKRKALGIKSQ